MVSGRLGAVGRRVTMVGMLAGASAAGAQGLGPSYPLVEPDMMAEIKNRALEMERNGELQRRLDEGNRRATESIRNPRSVDGVGVAVQRRTYFFDPTLTVNEDLVTPDGTLIARRGDRVNPLEQVAWTSVWIFIDARDSAQLTEARRLIAEGRVPVKPVLVGGSYIEASKALAARVYFDQSGLLVRRFGIRAVPATIRQEGLRLRIDEFPARR